MANAMKNMNLKIKNKKKEKTKEREPQPNDKINMRVWDEMKVERLRSDAVKVILTRNIEPEPKTIFSIKVSLGIECLVNTAEYEKLDDDVEYFKNSQISRVLASTVSCIISELTLHSQIGAMVTAPVVQFPQ